MPRSFRHLLTARGGYETQKACGTWYAKSTLEDWCADHPDLQIVEKSEDHAGLWGKLGTVTLKVLCHKCATCKDQADAAWMMGCFVCSEWCTRVVSCYRAAFLLFIFYCCHKTAFHLVSLSVLTFWTLIMVKVPISKFLMEITSCGRGFELKKKKNSTEWSTEGSEAENPIPPWI